MRHPPVMSIAALLSLSVFAACGPREGDDAFARQLIDRLQRRDSAGAAQLDPRSPIARPDWPALAASYVGVLPGGAPDSVVLTEWERGNDDHGSYRKLTYRLHRADSMTQVEVWLVTRAERTYANTVRAQRFQ